MYLVQTYVVIFLHRQLIYKVYRLYIEIRIPEFLIYNPNYLSWIRQHVLFLLALLQIMFWRAFSQSIKAVLNVYIYCNQKCMDNFVITVFYKILLQNSGNALQCKCKFHKQFLQLLQLPKFYPVYQQHCLCCIAFENYSACLQNLYLKQQVYCRSILDLSLQIYIYISKVQQFQVQTILSGFVFLVLQPSFFISWFSILDNVGYQCMVQVMIYNRQVCLKRGIDYLINIYILCNNFVAPFFTVVYFLQIYQYIYNRINILFIIRNPA
eukprot:TRINITY_DN204_c0_g1_i4.p2 TRINITY_DN204_c0_g1~~TRINITY_DN204_c0_g1_i4.p2  ORF type:complete len:267 (-),score=-27.50 TRINITY_DN204_c0_g1_i4:607-1407(-)